MTGAELTAFLAEWLLPICGVVHFGMLIAVLRSNRAMRATLEIHSQFFIELGRVVLTAHGVVPAGSCVAGAEAGGGVQPPPGFQPDIPVRGGL